MKSLSTFNNRENFCGRIVENVLEAAKQECQIDENVLVQLRNLWERNLNESGMTLPVLTDLSDSFSHLPNSSSLRTQLETSSGLMVHSFFTSFLKKQKDLLFVIDFFSFSSNIQAIQYYHNIIIRIVLVPLNHLSINKQRNLALYLVLLGVALPMFVFHSN